MKFFLLVALGIVTIAMSACRGQQLDSGEEELLLLEDEPEPTLSSASSADNSRCHVCHVNYVREELALVHARAGMSCAECHGDCDDHIADESWAWGGTGTPPEIMFSSATINPFCMDCHPGEKLDVEHHSDLLADLSGKQTCTDCHGEHRLNQRKQDWKSIGKLVGTLIE